jgi:hypothetical protein
VTLRALIFIGLSAGLEVLPSEANRAVPVGSRQAVAYVCAEDPCRLVLRDVNYRR